MPPVTADTNVYISAFNFGGVPLRFIELARSGVFRLAISAPIRTEVHRVLLDKFGWPPTDISDALSDLEACMVTVHPTQPVSVIPADPTDDRIIECALAAGSRHLVTGDSHLLRLGSYGDVQILNVADFLKLLPAGPTF